MTYKYELSIDSDDDFEIQYQGTPYGTPFRVLFETETDEDICKKVLDFLRDVSFHSIIYTDSYKINEANRNLKMFKKEIKKGNKYFIFGGNYEMSFKLIDNYDLVVKI
jgi:hypothetical protein